MKDVEPAPFIWSLLQASAVLDVRSHAFAMGTKGTAFAHLFYRRDHTRDQNWVEFPGRAAARWLEGASKSTWESCQVNSDTPYGGAGTEYSALDHANSEPQNRNPGVED
jgi:hypothetical protein